MKSLCFRPFHSWPHTSLHFVGSDLHLLLQKWNYKHSAFLSFVGHSSELSNLQCVGTLELVVSQKCSSLEGPQACTWHLK